MNMITIVISETHKGQGRVPFQRYAPLFYYYNRTYTLLSIGGNFMKKNQSWKRFAAGALATMMLVSLTACGGSAGKATSSTEGATTDSASASSKTQLNVGVSNLVSSVLNPAADSSGTGFTRAGIGESLMICDTKGELKPWLAESVESKDNVNWVVKLKADTKFSNGNVCDAAAVMKSLQYLTDNNKGLGKSLNIESMEVADATTLNIVTNGVTSDFLSYLSHPQSAIQDVTAADMDNAPVGTGPYKVDKFISQQEIDLSANTNYNNGIVNFKTVHYIESHDADALWLQLQSGELDMLVSPSSTNISSIKGDDTYAVASSSLTTRDRYLIYNLESNYTSNVNFRKGIDCLIDRKTIVETVMGGLAVEGVGCIPTGYSATPDYVGTSFDVKKALSYFEAAGLTVKDGKVSDNGAAISLKYHTYDSFPELSTIVQFIQSSLATVGINAEVTSTADDIDDYLGNEANSGSWDISMASMFAVPRGDAAYILNTSYDTNSQYNYSTARVPDDTLQNLIQSIKVTVDSKERENLIKEAALRVEEMCYISYYMNPTFNIVYNTKTIDNVTSYGSEQYFVNDGITAK